MYTQEELIEAVKNSFSIAEVLRKLTKKPAGGNYKIVKFNIKKYNLVTSHFTGQGHLKGKNHNWAIKIPDDKSISLSKSVKSVDLIILLSETVFAAGAPEEP